MRTLDIGKLRQEREDLTKRLETINQLLGLVDSLNGVSPKKAGRPRGKGRMSAAGRRRIQLAQKARWAKVRAAKKAAAKT
jgi:hypothetical protein